MAIFDYKAITRAGKSQKGFVESESIKAARAKLKKQGLMVTEIKEKLNTKAQAGGTISFMGGGIGLKEVSVTTRQLASLIKANIPLVEALSALVEQSEKETLKLVLTRIREEVNEGSSLSKALAKHPKTFDNIYINMVEAGESSGNLGLVLLKLADFKEAQMRLRAKVKSAMTYPTLMLGVAFLLVTAIFTFVIPKLTKVFDDLNKPVPALTKFLIVVSQIVVNYWYLIFAAIVFGLMFFFKTINTKAGRWKWDGFTLTAPVFGSLVRMVAVARFSSTLSTLLGSGVPILTAMGIAKNLVGNVRIEKAVEDAKENVTEGQSIADPLKRSGEFPPLVIHMISIGEKTGELPEMLKNISENYEEQIATKIDGMTALLEPVMIIGMGGMVGFIVLAIFVPLLELNNVR